MPQNMIEYTIPTINVAEQALEYGISQPEIPEYITNNLQYSFYDWQQKALKKFLLYQTVKEKENSDTLTHLMFNMATGTGKTLLMAATLLYYYKQGYRHFLFFVNRNNIVDKTENNFINAEHRKYLFTEKIVIDDATVSVKQVEIFSDFPHGIEIKFTSIQKLYNDIHVQRENQTTLDDLHSKDIVMLADEAHHLNTNTKNVERQGNVFEEQEQLSYKEITNKTSEKDRERLGWEHTVIELILHKNSRKVENRNVLLEFTATIPEGNSIQEKYQDKIIYKFGLKEFLAAGYTKEINLISSTLSKKERVLQALLFQWYRHKIALKHNIANFKPVILFRSKTIEESESDYAEFLHWMDTISVKDFDFFKTISDRMPETKQPVLFEMGKSRTGQVLEFITNEKIGFLEIADWMKQSYQVYNVIITNSKTNKTKTDENTKVLLNSLEDKDNHVRAIFTVDRLTEGWDVLNLFDIVRLYQGQNAGGSTKKTPEATIKEKQLIGRGVRYFPFAYADKNTHKRKFDKNLNHELRVLEELYYYTYDEESRYISHLKAELKKDGYISDDKTLVSFALKEEFQKSNFYQHTKIWHNTQIDNPYRTKPSLNDITENLEVTYKIASLELHEEKIDLEGADEPRVEVKEKRKTITIPCKDIEKHIFLKAINIKAKQESSLFQFEKLKKELAITSIDDVQEERFLGSCKVHIIVDKNIDYDALENEDKLNGVLKLLDEFMRELKKTIVPKIGSEFKAGDFRKFFSTPKTKSIEEKNKRDDSGEKNIVENDWYVLDSFVGTSEEKELINFIKNNIENLKEKYEKIKLLKNEEVYKIYDFEQGRGFQPDFLLFLKEKTLEDKKQQELHYQIFIEPKGTHLFEHDEWKAEFLCQITKRYGLTTNILQAEHFQYTLIGLPFFNTGNNTNFKKEYQKLM